VCPSPPPASAAQLAGRLKCFLYTASALGKKPFLNAFCGEYGSEIR
jgi:hypothetical protein